ncbi:hypothetical protein [Massilia sp. KIM]|uniref:hypothetical protein n=1 Tax=Massilia sp. KIM TaxID=1955422 RepID=UPI00117C6982|nr:hypothetical protein [Massilia sp. KIM]
MEKNRQRALRRHHLERVKKKRADYAGGYVRQLPDAERLRRIGLYANTVPVCSCWMCGNPRRHLHESSLKEKLAELILAIEVGDLDKAD